MASPLTAVESEPSIVTRTRFAGAHALAVQGSREASAAFRRTDASAQWTAVAGGFSRNVRRCLDAAAHEPGSGVQFERRSGAAEALEACLAQGALSPAVERRAVGA